jgi:hypothetical protein
MAILYILVWYIGCVFSHFRRLYQGKYGNPGEDLHQILRQADVSSSSSISRENFDDQRPGIDVIIFEIFSPKKIAEKRGDFRLKHSYFFPKLDHNIVLFFLRKAPFFGLAADQGDQMNLFLKESPKVKPNLLCHN